MGFYYLAAKKFLSAIKCYKKVKRVSVNLFYLLFPAFFLAWSCVSCDQFQNAEDTFKAILSFSESFGVEIFVTPAHTPPVVALLAEGYMAYGLKMIEDSMQSFS